jgi:hypothetical protein
MPIINGRYFPYTAQGRADADAFRERTGDKIEAMRKKSPSQNKKKSKKKAY